jgi:anti-sigma regulatory factor (Ser/Thr protein kinase)
LKTEKDCARRQSGIADIELAMQEGIPPRRRIRDRASRRYGTSQQKRYSDEFDIQSKVNEGTTVTLSVYF